MAIWNSRTSIVSAIVVSGLAVAAYSLSAQPVSPQLPTTIADWTMPGTQELTLNVSLAPGDTCSGCHGYYDDAIEPYSNWAASMMGQATRDPVWYAAMAIANQDADFAGDLCLRCHTPNGWLHGKSVPTDGSALDVFNGDMDGVGCHFCHRMVDPVADAANPAEDTGILAALTTAIPVEPHSAQYVVDPDDRRRGPFNLGANFPYHEWRKSPFHQDSALCGTCHDVSNPAYTKQLDGTFVLNPTNAEHPTHIKGEYFPVERTYSEWANSQFALEEIELGGLFGGNKTAVSSCQDCHMPDGSGEAAAPQWGAQFRNDQPLHFFNGGNTWVLKAIRSLYPDFETGLTAVQVDNSIARAVGMLKNSAVLEASIKGNQLNVRVLNNTGHKLPTGYPEGRRMWLNVRYLDGGGNLIVERGGYDANSATLTTSNTTVFEAELGVDAAVAAATGVPEGVGFHFALNNVIHKDNRIPPRGFTNAAFEAAGAPVMDEEYLDEQYWHDSLFGMPAGTADIQVRLFYQTTSKEYIEFLRDNNTSNNTGDIAYRAWDVFGKSAPVEMAMTTINVGSVPCPQPIEYGYVIENSSTNEMHLSYSGTPSLSAGNFTLEITGGVPNAQMAIFSGKESRHLDLPGGLFLVGDSVRRSTVVQLDGSGAASVPTTVDPTFVDGELYYQAICRDPGTPGNLAHSNGLHVDFCN